MREAKQRVFAQLRAGKLQPVLLALPGPMDVEHCELPEGWATAPLPEA